MFKPKTIVIPGATKWRRGIQGSDPPLVIVDPGLRMDDDGFELKYNITPLGIGSSTGHCFGRDTFYIQQFDNAPAYADEADVLKIL